MWVWFMNLLSIFKNIFGENQTPIQPFTDIAQEAQTPESDSSAAREPVVSSDNDNMNRQLPDTKTPDIDPVTPLEQVKDESQARLSLDNIGLALPLRTPRRPPGLRNKISLLQENQRLSSVISSTGTPRPPEKKPEPLIIPLIPEINETWAAPRPPVARRLDFENIKGTAASLVDTRNVGEQTPQITTQSPAVTSTVIHEQSTDRLLVTERKEQDTSRTIDADEIDMAFSDKQEAAQSSILPTPEAEKSALLNVSTDLAAVQPAAPDTKKALSSDEVILTLAKHHSSLPTSPAMSSPKKHGIPPLNLSPENLTAAKEDIDAQDTVRTDDVELSLQTPRSPLRTKPSTAKTEAFSLFSEDNDKELMSRVIEEEMDLFSPRAPVSSSKSHASDKDLLQALLDFYQGLTTKQPTACEPLLEKIKKLRAGYVKDEYLDQSDISKVLGDIYNLITKDNLGKEKAYKASIKQFVGIFHSYFKLRKQIKDQLKPSIADRARKFIGSIFSSDSPKEVLPLLDVAPSQSVPPVHKQRPIRLNKVFMNLDNRDENKIALAQRVIEAYLSSIKLEKDDLIDWQAENGFAENVKMQALDTLAEREKELNSVATILSGEKTEALKTARQVLNEFRPAGPDFDLISKPKHRDKVCLGSALFRQKICEDLLALLHLTEDVHHYKKIQNKSAKMTIVSSEMERTLSPWQAWIQCLHDKQDDSEGLVKCLEALRQEYKVPSDIPLQQQISKMQDMAHAQLPNTRPHSQRLASAISLIADEANAAELYAEGTYNGKKFIEQLPTLLNKDHGLIIKCTQHSALPSGKLQAIEVTEKNIEAELPRLRNVERNVIKYDFEVRMSVPKNSVINNKITCWVRDYHERHQFQPKGKMHLGKVSGRTQTEQIAVIQKLKHSLEIASAMGYTKIKFDRLPRSTRLDQIVPGQSFTMAQMAYVLIEHNYPHIEPINARENELRMQPEAKARLKQKLEEMQLLIVSETESEMNEASLHH